MVSNFLLTVQPAMGHLNPMLAIATELRERGHRVTFALPVAARVAAALQGFPVIDLPVAWSSLGLTLLPFTSGGLESTLAMQSFFAGLVHYARKLDPLLDEIRPDAVLSDFAFPAAGLAAERRQLPCALVYSAGLPFAGPGVPPPGSGLAIGAEWGLKGWLCQVAARWMMRSLAWRVRRARARLGLLPTPLTGVECLVSSWLTLVLTTEACEAPRGEVPDCVFYVGPCLRPGCQSDLELAQDRPVVYVSLGTVFNNKPKVFHKIIQAFEDGAVQLVVSAGGAYAKLAALPRPKSVLLFPKLDQISLLPQVDAVISHGGNNTVNETLAAGKPLLVMPVGGEQADNASRVVYLGAGLRADLTTSSAAEIRREVLRLVTESAFRQRAQQLAAAISKTSGTHTAARFLERLATTRQPLVRRPGYPLTVESHGPDPWDWPQDPALI